MRRIIASTFLATLALAAPASAEVAHIVQPGETLWSIAAANNLTTRTVAAYNGLSEDAQVVLGSTIRVPDHRRGLRGAPERRLVAAARGGRARPPRRAAPPRRPARPPPQGGYTVRPGDTLSGLAAGAGVSVADMAAMNGLDPAGLLIAGHRDQAADRRPGARARRRARARAGRPGRPTRRRRRRASAPATSRPSRRSTASRRRSPPRSRGRRAASTTRWSPSANARGVMQVMPGTWDYVQQNLAQRQLDPNSATDNVHAGVMYLKQLLDADGRRRERRDRGLLPGPRLGPAPRPVRRHAALRGQRAGAALALRRLAGATAGGGARRRRPTGSGRRHAVQARSTGRMKFAHGAGAIPTFTP